MKPSFEPFQQKSSNTYGSNNNNDNDASNKENMTPSTGMAQQHAINEIKLFFEEKLLNVLEDLDDPLELFMEYIASIVELVPENDPFLMNMIERCLLYIIEVDTYLNDPRYLSVWLRYIQLLEGRGLMKTEPEVLAIFQYMFNMKIGSRLALFYEAFSQRLARMNRFIEAHYIMELGIQRNARPYTRIIETLHNFEDRLRNSGIDLNNEPAVDLKFIQQNVIPSFIESHSGTNFFHELEQHDKSRREQLGNKPLLWKVNKEITSIYESNVKGLNHLPFVNTEPTPETGAVITKLPVFTDNIIEENNKTSTLPKKVHKIIEVSGRKPEQVDCNFDLLYVNDDQEFCIEEILALSRGLYYKTREHKGKNSKELNALLPASTLQKKKRRKLGPLMEKSTDIPSVQRIPLSTSASVTQISSDEAKQIQPKNDYVNVTKISILPLKDEPQTMEDLNKTPKRSDVNKAHTNSPTVTMYSKDAMNEIYSMFNQHYQESDIPQEKDDTTGKFSLDDNFTQEFTRQNIDDLTEIKPPYPSSIPHETPKRIETEDTDDIISDPSNNLTYKSKLAFCIYDTNPRKDRKHNAFTK